MSAVDVDLIMERAKKAAIESPGYDIRLLSKEVLILIAEIERLRAEVLRLCMERPADARE